MNVDMTLSIKTARYLPGREPVHCRSLGRRLRSDAAILDSTATVKCESSAHQVLDIYSVPFIPDQQVLIGSERLAASACTRLSIFLAR
jgi:hypothetical protein